jgi:sec-independent protein translocase protein TatC
MTDITHYLDFVLMLFFAFGLAFEVPIATIVLVMAGATTPEKLAAKRPYVIVGAFVIGMVLTPPDIISQTLLALPMWVLFEVGLVFSRMVVRNRRAREEAEEVDTAAAGAVPVTAGGFEPLDDQEMEDEFDRIEREFDELEDTDDAKKTSGQEPPADAGPDEAVEEAAEAFSAEDSADMLDEEDEFPQRTATEALVDAKLQQVVALRATGATDEARRLLYEVLSEGNDTQVRVARNILEQLDS